MTRPTWDEYFSNIAIAISARADCTRAQHGAVIVKNNRIVSTGYNGAPAGQPGCLSGACPRTQTDVPTLSNYDNCISNHAESNALLYGDHHDIRGATIYITGPPCPWCSKLMAGAGIHRIVHPERNHNAK